MRRFSYVALILLLLLTACGSSGAGEFIQPPPQSTPIQSSSNAQINQYIERLKVNVPQAMEAQGIKNTEDSPLEQFFYESTASLAEIEQAYATLTEKDWYRASGMPINQDGVLIDGYEKGSTSLVIQAIEQSKFGGTGVLVYVVKGNK